MALGTLEPFRNIYLFVYLYPFTHTFSNEWLGFVVVMISADMQQRVLRFSRTVPGKKLLEGAGVQICRTIGYQDVRVDPFLMLDELRLPAERASAGFPDHPHRGFETCTLMMDGKMQHQDSCGNKGVIEAGGAQWMTAGRGIIHSEMPVVTNGDLHGFQLWINLPGRCT